MYNDLFTIFGQTLHTYGVMIALGFLSGLYLASRKAAVSGIEPKRIGDIAFPVLIASLIGARVLYIITNIDHYEQLCKVNNDCFAALRLWEGGLVFFGGLILAIIVGSYYIKKFKLNLFALLDVLAIGAPIGHAFGRLGCFFAGCCYGYETDTAPGIEFPKNSIPFNDQVKANIIDKTWEHSHAVHSTQLYESFLVIIIFAILWIFFNRKRFHGQIVLMYLMFYSVARFILEFFRADEERKHLFKIDIPAFNDFLGLPKGIPTLLSTSQFISIIMIIGAIGIWIYKIKKLKNTSLKTKN